MREHQVKGLVPRLPLVELIQNSRERSRETCSRSRPANAPSHTAPQRNQAGSQPSHTLDSNRTNRSQPLPQDSPRHVRARPCPWQRIRQAATEVAAR